MSNAEWVKLIAEEFSVSRSTARDMLHAMYVVKKMKEWDTSYDRERYQSNL